MLGSLFTRTKQDAINQALKESLKAHIGKPFHIYFHDGKADINSQIADHCSWAIYRSLEDGETRPLEEIETKIRTKFDMFERGPTDITNTQKIDHPAYPLREEPGGSCQRGGTFAICRESTTDAQDTF